MNPPSAPQTRRPATDRPYVHSGFFALRTPLLPLQAFLDWGRELTAPEADRQKDRLGRDRETLEAAVVADRALLRQRLVALLEDPVVREAVFIASPDLNEAVEVWRHEPESPKGQRAEESLVRYFTRMAFRPTPFGIFAGCSVGEIGETTRLRLEGRQSYRRHARLDMEYLTSLSEALGRQEEVRREVDLPPNPTLYRLGQRFRYAESRPTERGRSHHLVAITATPHLEAVLNHGGGRRKFPELVAQLTAIDGVTAPDAEAFVHTLIDNQVLAPGLAPRITGPEPTQELIASCAAHPSTRQVAERLGEAQARFDAIEACELGIAPERYLEVAEGLASLPAEVKLSRLFQVDLVKPVASAQLAEPVLEAALRGVEALYFMAPAHDQNEVFRHFAAEFTKRYETQEVPLVEALDEEYGIGFSKSSAPGAEPSPVLEDVLFAAPSPERTGWGLRERGLLQLLLDAQARGDQEVALNPSLLGALAGRARPPLPAAFSVLMTLAADSEEALQKGKFEMLLGVNGGPSGANLLGRFCHTDPRLEAGVREHIAREEELDPNAVFAEVVHLPEGRVGNIILRPELRRHSIPLLGTAGESPEHAIPITDLTVSVRQGRVVLRSRRLGRRIHPRLTTAHSYFTNSNLGIYKFLCSLQWQGTCGYMAWNWAPFHTATFLPRVRLGNLILERAQWLIERHEIGALLKVKDGKRFHEVQRLREQRRLPSKVVLVDTDNELLVDFDNILSIDAFLAVVKQRAFCAVKELFPDPDRLCTRGPEGQFVSEIVVPFVRQLKEPPAPRPPAGARAARPDTTRIFQPGSEWLYAKLYTGTSTADWVLRDTVAPLVARLQQTGQIDRWHFIRFSDPDFHLRLRLHGEPEVLMGAVFPQLRDALALHLASREVWKFQLDGYQREVERYGGAQGIQLAEQLFHHDSEMMLAFLARLRGDALNNGRWRLALKAIDTLLDDLGFDLETKRRLMQGVSEDFAREFYFKDTPLRHQISKKFRQEQADLELLLDPERSPGHPLAPLFDVLGRRSRSWGPTIAALHEASSELSPALETVAVSYIHMMANRMLRSASRAQELLLYSYLFRVYDSQLARLRQKAKRKAPGVA